MGFKLSALSLALVGCLTAQPAQAQTNSTGIKVEPGLTLWRIAYTYPQRGNLSVDKMMELIFFANPQAFSSDDYTSLRAGSVLVMPQTESQQSVASTQNKVLEPEQEQNPETPQTSVTAAPKAQPPKNVTPVSSVSDTTDYSNYVFPEESKQSALQTDGKLALETRYFPQDAAYTGQSQTQFSGSALLEFYLPWNDEYDGISFSPYYRYDSEDEERTHADIRELKYFHVGDSWEVHVGIDKVFWGVTETLHLVDIVNQTDFVEAPDGEDKLGQPMVHLSTLHDWGTLDFFVLPYFRERTYPGWEGRLRGPLAVDPDKVIYESAQEQKHVDYAMRWSHSWNNWETALSAFKGTSREPQLINSQNADGQLQALAFYPQITQVGIESLYIVNSWIWKLEAIRRQGNLIEDYTASDIGFEYTFYGVNDSVIDVGLLMEHQYDSRGAGISMSQNDLFIGTRIAFNDVDGSEILAGFAQDLDYSDSRSMLLEAKTRLSPAWTANLDIWLFDGKSPEEMSYWIRQDDFVQLSVEYHF
ncbi:type IV pilus assembly protein FimV [Neptunicella marina]|uniref:LysM domain-containing protein n=1 Tax=Neptunicella marina TaxID=2125989 RepID=A0A8J6IVU9_9ALTE|nr:FimV/HubP family polar landmark protein [Neptunicella marina]MBC3766496.1 hypothetical protein [Neptunicella marina]